MTTFTSLQPDDLDTTAVQRPTKKRRAALALAGVLACAMPVLFTLNITRMLLTGVLPDHRFHQLTGQGEILFALWLWPIGAMLRAGWGGRRPATWTGYMHLSLIATGALTAAVAPGGGAPFLVAVIAIGGAVLWAVLPARPRLRVGLQVDPLMAPIALLGSALLLPYALDQLGLQNAATGHHAKNPHFFDQAWIAVDMATLALLAALVPAARGLARWFAGGMIVLGAAGLALGEDVVVFAGLLAVGMAAAVARAVITRSQVSVAGVASRRGLRRG